MKELILFPEEIYYIGKVSGGKYLDYDYIAAMQDISDSLEGLDPLASFDPEQVSLVDQRNGRRLNAENSLLEECVWNGDILEIQGYR